LPTVWGWRGRKGPSSPSCIPQARWPWRACSRGDVIIGFEGRAIESAQEFGFRVGTVKIGESRIVEYRRGEARV
jgi:S1-C subfamily serine protease